MERAELGIDGNCGFALLGENLQEGEAEFVEIDNDNDNLRSINERRVCSLALINLRKRLPDREFSYYIGMSHPGYC